MNHLVSKFIIFLIRTYQIAISPYLGQKCRFTPTCSSYAIECYKKKNFLNASYLTIKRIVKCHPFHPGGHDPL